MVLEPFSILTMSVDTQNYTGDKIVSYTHTHTHIHKMENRKNLGNLNKIGGLYQMSVSWL